MEAVDMEPDEADHDVHGPVTYVGPGGEMLTSDCCECEECTCEDCAPR